MKLLARKLIRYWLMFVIICLGSPADAQSLPSSSRQDSLVVMLNDRPVQLVTHQYGEQHIRFLALHDSENTGLQAAFKFIGIYGGSVVELRNRHFRNINFLDSLKEFSFDPNRMFTYEGTYLGLARYSQPQIHEGLTEKVRRVGDELLKYIKADSPGVIISLHNNYNEGFGIYSYKEGNYLEKTAEDLFINPDMDPDDLVYVTDRRFFDYLKQKKINVILQSQQAPDDGSLSIFAMQSQKPYVNIEVQHGHFEENYRLILIISDMLKEMPQLYYSNQNR
jgi:hypothetical protein